MRLIHPRISVNLNKRVTRAYIDRLKSPGGRARRVGLGIASEGMDDDAVRGLLQAAFRFTNAAGLQQFGTSEREAEEALAVDDAKHALSRLLAGYPVNGAGGAPPDGSSTPVRAAHDEQAPHQTSDAPSGTSSSSSAGSDGSRQSAR